MNRTKTAQLLNEWKSFLNEGVKTKFSKKDIGKKVKIIIDKENEEFFSAKDIEKYSGKVGELISHDVNDRKNEKIDKMVNFVVVSINDKEKQFPDKCVKIV